MLATPDVDVLLDILGNDTRRKILQLLAEEPRYLLQLAKELNVSQQAVLKHMTLLEKYCFVTSFEEESELAGPPRKYYELKKSLRISIGITSDDVNIALHEVPSRTPNTVFPGELKDIEKRISELERNTDVDTVLEDSDRLVAEITGKMQETEQYQLALLQLKQLVTRIAHVKIRESSDKLLERRILYSILGKSESPDIEALSEAFNIREKEIEAAVESLRQRLFFLQRRLLQ